MAFENVETFLAVLDTGSIQAAAGRLKVSRATVRRRLDEIEAMLGVPLLRRTRKGAFATPSGEVLAEQGRVLVQHAELLLESVREVESKPSGILRFAIRPGLPLGPMAMLHQTMMSMWPEVTLEFMVRQNPRAALPSDAHIAVDFRQDDVGYGFDVVDMQTLPVRLLAAREYLERAGRPEDVGDLDQHDLLVWSDSSDAAALLPTRQGTWVSVAPRVVSNDIQTLRNMVGNGAGIGFLPDGGFPQELDTVSNLERVLPDLIGSERTLELVVPTAMRTLPRVRALLDWVKGLSALPTF